MRLVVNGETLETDAKTLEDLLTEMGKATAKVATSVNETFVPKTARTTKTLDDGDRIEIVAPRQGG